MRTGQSVASALDGWVQLSTGEKVPTQSLIWCVGVRPDPLVDGLSLATSRGRLVVDEFMAVPGADGIYACGDCAAVPDLTRPGEVTGMTAQHATRQGRLVARNAVTRAYHLYAMSGNRARVSADWALNTLTPRRPPHSA